MSECHGKPVCQRFSHRLFEEINGATQRNFRLCVFKLAGYTEAKKVSQGALPRDRRDDRPSHGRSLASDPHGRGKCQNDVGNIVDHAITAFVSPFTSDGMFDFGLNQEPRMDSGLSQKLRVVRLFMKEMGHGKPVCRAISDRPLMLGQCILHQENRQYSIKFPRYIKMLKVVQKIVLLPAVFALVMALMACDSESDQATTEAQPNIETESEAETVIAICDEFGNRYLSEDEPKAKGLEMHQYGATYCPEYKPELNSN